MYRGENSLGEIRRQRPSATLGDPKLLSHQRLRCSRAERHDHLGPHLPDFFLKPWITGPNFTGAGLLMQPTSSFDSHKLEVLHRIRDIDPTAVDARGFEAAVQQTTCRPHK